MLLSVVFKMTLRKKMASFNDNHELDNEQYYAEILRYLEDPTGVNINTSTKAQWIRTQAANYFVCF